MKNFIKKRKIFEEKFDSLKEEIMFALYGEYGDDEDTDLKSYAQYYRFEMEGMKEDVGEYIIAMLKAGIQPTDSDVAKFVLITEHMHIGNDDKIIKCVSLEKLKEIASQLLSA